MVNKMQAEMPAFYSLLPTGISFPKIMGNPCKIGEEILYINIDLSITRCRIWTKTSMNEIIIGKNRT